MVKKVAIITGGSSGIGKACAIELGKKDYRIVITGRNQENLISTSNELKESGIENIFIQADAQKEGDHIRMVDETINQFGRIDILINNAGISMNALFEETKLDVLKQVMDSNFWGTVYATKYCLPHLINSKGSINLTK
jgi:NADP-dependent 3-hydroxy acid dehydrogenase YdfG